MQLVGPDAGAACDRDTKHGSGMGAEAPSTSPKYIHRRFQSGAVDEIVFAGPDVGQLEVRSGQYWLYTSS